MTLGGLALAVGILVDEATVTIENVHSHLGRGAALAVAAYDGTNETTVPRFLAMLASSQSSSLLSSCRVRRIISSFR
jgi:multidrug efflux pump subunit AcrB